MSNRAYTEGAVPVHGINENFIFGLAIMIQLSGLITLLAARFCRNDCQVIWNLLFFAALFLVGLITFISIRQESGHWLISSATLAIMIVGSVVESTDKVAPSAI